MVSSIDFARSPKARDPMSRRASSSATFSSGGAETGARGGVAVDSAAPDRRDGRVYRASDAVRMAIMLAVVTRRPLLLRGDPVSG